MKSAQRLWLHWYDSAVPSPVFDAIQTQSTSVIKPTLRLLAQTFSVQFCWQFCWQLKRRTKARDRFEPCRLRGFCNTLIPSELDQPFPIHVLSLHRRMCCNDTRYQTVGLLRDRVNHGLAGSGVNLCSRQVCYKSKMALSLANSCVSNNCNLDRHPVAR